MKSSKELNEFYGAGLGWEDEDFKELCGILGKRKCKGLSVGFSKGLSKGESGDVRGRAKRGCVATT